MRKLTIIDGQSLLSLLSVGLPPVPRFDVSLDQRVLTLLLQRLARVQLVLAVSKQRAKPE